MWTATGSVSVSASGARVVGDTTLIFQGGAGITGVDTATGATRFSLDKGHDLTGHGGTWGGGVSDVLTDDDVLLMGWHYSADCSNPPGRGVCHESAEDQEGLALVSTTDGHTVWQTTIIPSFPEEVDYATRPALLLEAVNDGVALVSIGAGLGAFEHKTPPTSTIAIDVRTGATLWESKDGMWPLTVFGDTVFGDVQNGTTWTFVGADLATGKRKWTHTGDESYLEHVAGGVALLSGENKRYVLVDVTTGRTVTEFDHPEYIRSCGGDHRTVIACTAHNAKTSDDTVMVFRVDKRTVTTVPVDYDGDLRIDDGWFGRLQLSGTPSSSTDSRRFTMDSAGNVIDANLRLPGTIEGLSDDRAMVLTKDGVIEVYPVLR